MGFVTFVCGELSVEEARSVESSDLQNVSAHRPRRLATRATPTRFESLGLFPVGRDK